MRKITLGLLGSLVAFFATAQISSVDPNSAPVMVSHQVASNVYSGPINVAHSKSAGQLSALGDTIFYSNFNSSANWTAQSNGTVRGWQIGTANSWYFGTTGITSTSGADWACLKPGDPNAGALTAASFNLTSSPINCVGKNAVNLSFEQFYAKFEDTAMVQISTDNVNWTTIYDNSWVPITSASSGNQATSNPHYVTVNVTQYAANQATVYVRFRWVSRQTVQPGIGYGWYIDDVLLSEGDDNDINLISGYVATDSDTTKGNFENYYSMIPAKQANKAPMEFSATYKNAGGVAQTNTRVNMQLSGPGLFSASGTSSAKNLPYLGIDSNTVNLGPYYLSNGVGAYEIDLFATSDSQLARGAADTVTYNVMVSDSVYARDDNNADAASQVYYNPFNVSQYEVGTLYEVFEVDTVSSVSFYLGSANAQPNKNGSITCNIYSAGDLGVSGPLTLANAPIFSSNKVTVSALNVPANGGWITLPVARVGGGLDTINPGNYVVSIIADQFFGSDTIYLSLAERGTAWQGHYFLRQEQSTGWGNWSYSTNATYVRLNTTPKVCPVLNGMATATATTTCGATDGSATVVDPTNGTGPYTYAWGITGNPTTKTVSNLGSGAYDVTITDVEGCKLITSATVSDAGAPVFKNENTTDVLCAGNGEGAVSFELTAGAAGPGYTIVWKKGSSVITPGGGATRADSVLSGVEAGIYTVEITDGGNPPCKQTKTYTIGGATQAISSSHISSDVTCNGLTDGEGIVTSSGGTGTLSLLWPGGQTTATVTGLAAATYPVTITDGNSCTSIENVVVNEPNAIVIRPVPLTTVTIDLGNKTVTVVPSVLGGTGTLDYSWVNPSNDPCVANSTTGELVIGPAQNAAQREYGVYKLTVTDFNNCNTTGDITIGEENFLNATSVVEFGNDFKLQLFPNPNTGAFNIQMTNADKNDYTFEVKNVAGQVVYNETTEIAGDYFKSVELNNSGTGIYFLTISNGSGSASYKIIVE
ncbi:MAG: T9SS type A sorting domain-containing protein [Salibacteraceae bacterium]